MSEEITLERVQALVTRAPYHQWLGLQVVALYDDGIELKVTWREEWVVNPDRRYTHGGVLATLIDIGGDWAMVKKTGRGVPTINLHVDYHAVAMPGDLTIPAGSCGWGVSSRPRRRRCSTRRTSSSPAAAAPTSRLHRRDERCGSRAQRSAEPCLASPTSGTSSGAIAISTRSQSSISAASARARSATASSMPWPTP